MKSVFGFERVAMTPGKVVKAFRTNFGFTHRELAKITDIKESNISAIENDRREVGLKTAIKLGAAFGLNPELILFPRGYQRTNNRREINEIQKRATKLVSMKKQFG